jgi:hypothetical protein
MNKNISDSITEFKFSDNKFISNKNLTNLTPYEKFERYVLENRNVDVKKFNYEEDENTIRHKFHDRLKRMKEVKDANKIKLMKDLNLDEVIVNNTLKQKEYVDKLFQLPEYNDGFKDKFIKNTNLFWIGVILSGTSFLKLIHNIADDIYSPPHISIGKNSYPTLSKILIKNKFNLIIVSISGIFALYQNYRLKNLQNKYIKLIRDKYFMDQDLDIDRINIINKN